MSIYNLTKWFKILFCHILYIILFYSIIYADTAPRVIPPATEAMQHPEFWISRIKGNPDTVILTPEQIHRLNRKNRTRSFESTDINGNPSSIQSIVDRKDIIGIQFKFENPLTITSFPADSLRTRLKRQHDYFEHGTFFDRRQIEYDKDMKNDLYEMTAYDSIPDTVIPRHGILTAHTLNRIMPTNLPVSSSAGGWLDHLQSASLDFGTPVAILHTSKNNDWYYVRSETAFGWIPSVNVAEGTIEQIEKIVEAENFIVVTCHKVPLYADKECTIFLADFYMGAHLPLHAKSDSGYEVIVPFRGADGLLKPVTGWVKPDSGVSVGYQKFSQRNILTTIFSLLYRPYGWADSNNERDCCGTIRVVYKTFGILLPRWTTHQLHSTDHVYVFPRETPKNTKYEILDSCEPALTLVGDSGHIIMYLGKTDGIHYVIHQSGYDYKSEAGTVMMVRRVNVNDTELEGGSHVKNWTEISVFKP